MAEEEDLPIRETEPVGEAGAGHAGDRGAARLHRRMREEIARVEADITRKNSHKSAADAFFRKPG